MSIRISNTSIHFGNFTLTANTEGFSFDGKIRAKRGFIDNKTPGAQGQIFGYASGGYLPSLTDTIQKFPFAVDTNATDVGNLTQARSQASGASSKTHGYVVGGYLPGATNTIDKFSYALDSNASDVGDLVGNAQDHSGNSSDTHGYAQGTDSTSTDQTIEKFPFATDTNASSVGLLFQSRVLTAGSSSRTHGYTSGGWSPERDTIDKYPFAVDTNASDVGNLSAVRRQTTGGQSKDNGYVVGGSNSHPGTGIKLNEINKFPFSSDTNATDIADLTLNRNWASVQCSLTHGYASGGNAPASGSTSPPDGEPQVQSNKIDKFPFSTDTNATDVGDLIASAAITVGAQN